MTTAEQIEMRTQRGPERPGGQGLDHNQEESANRAIHMLLASYEGRAWTDFVATFRADREGNGAYEAWAARGMVRWTRHYGARGGYEYRVVEVVGQNPLERQDHRALHTLEQQLAAGRENHPERAYIEPENLTYPHAYERLSQLFDSPNAPDLAVNPRSYAYGRQPGQHGALDVIQARSPLIFSGPGIRPGESIEADAKQVDIAPTIARLLGFPLVDGRDGSGRSSSERGVSADVYFKRQDGRVLDEVIDSSSSARPERAYILLLDGQSHMELTYRLRTEPSAVPNLRRLIARGAMLKYGSMTNFPSITWPSHNAIGTSCWSGHHDIVNPTYYLRERKETVSPQGQTFDTAKFLGDEVETLFEAFHRVFGSWNGMTGAFTASINEPCTRGADHAALERRLVGDREWLKQLTAETEGDISPRWTEELQAHGHHTIGLTDNRALAQARQLFLDESHPAPMFVFHEFSLPDGAAHDYGPHHDGAREALDETDVRIGHILSLLESKGLFESTLFVVTTDHGMALQDTSLQANPARIPERGGMAAVTTEPLIYLRDLDVGIGVAHDGRTAQISVLDNDADVASVKRPVSGAQVLVTDHRDGKVASARTDEGGNAGIAIPADLLPSELAVAIHADGYNSRHMRLDGSNLALDLREALYGTRTRT